MSIVVDFSRHKAIQHRKACLRQNQQYGLLQLCARVDVVTTDAQHEDFVDLFEFMKYDNIDRIVEELYSTNAEDWSLFPAYYRALSRIVEYRFSFLANRL